MSFSNLPIVIPVVMVVLVAVAVPMAAAVAVAVTMATELLVFVVKTFGMGRARQKSFNDFSCVTDVNMRMYECFLSN